MIFFYYLPLVTIGYPPFPYVEMIKQFNGEGSVKAVDSSSCVCYYFHDVIC